MARRIRGHYRIDCGGRVEPLKDVNAAAKPYTFPPERLSKRPDTLRSRFKNISIAGTSIFVLGMGMLMAVPKIEQAMLSAQSADMASVRATYIQNHPKLQKVLDNYH